MVSVKSVTLARGHQRSREIRHAAAQLRHELASGAIPPAAAVHDDRAGVLTAYTLAVTVRGVGPDTARNVLARIPIRETTRIRELTDRQRGRLAALLEVVGR